MKKKYLLAVMLLMVTGLQTIEAQKVVLHKTNGEKLECPM